MRSSNVDNVAVVAPTQRSGAASHRGRAELEHDRSKASRRLISSAKDWSVATGRMFDDSEDRQARKVAVLGQTVVTNLFPNTDPIGQTHPHSAAAPIR